MPLLNSLPSIRHHPHRAMALRRNVRLRREYLYRKSLEGKERAQYEAKRRIRQALQGMLCCLCAPCAWGCCTNEPGLNCPEGKALPTELRGQEKRLRHEIELEDDVTAKQRVRGEAASCMKQHPDSDYLQPTMDDEYASAGVLDPKVCVTTSREPSSRLKQFAKEVRLIFPNSQRVNRGNTTVKELVAACRKAGFTDIIVLQETRGEPGGCLWSMCGHVVVGTEGGGGRGGTAR